MPAQLGLTNVTVTGRYKIAISGGFGQADNVGAVEVGGGTWSATATIQGNPFSAAQDPTNASWQNIAAIRLDTAAVETGGNQTFTANTARTWIANIAPFQQFALNITVITGTIPLNVLSYYQSGGLNIVPAASVSSNLAVAGTLTVTANSANAFDVGAAGATNPALQVTTSTGTQATGLNIIGNTAGSGVELQTITSGTNEQLNIDAAAAAKIVLGGTAATATGTTMGSSTAAANTIVTVYSSNATALLVGPNGATNPTLTVVCSTATAKTGLSATSAAAGSGMALATTSNATNESLTIDAKGSGIVTLASVSTGGCNVRVPVATVAASGNAIGNAAAVTEGFTYATGANNNAALILPVAGIGAQVTIVNTVTTAGLFVFPQVSSQINALGNNASYNMPNASKRTFYKATAVLWYTDPVTII